MISVGIWLTDMLFGFLAGAVCFYTDGTYPRCRFSSWNRGILEFYTSFYHNLF
jgi:hypothetical protein